MSVLSVRPTDPKDEVDKAAVKDHISPTGWGLEGDVLGRIEAANRPPHNYNHNQHKHVNNG